MKTISILLIVAFFAVGKTAYAQKDLDEIEISLLTASPGEKLYSVFGHNALRIKNNTTGLDIVFNYGMFSFSDPDFYMNFIKGRMNYWLDTESYRDFLNSYVSENRGIREQVFEMDSIQKQFFIHFLENNLKSENRYYQYHFWGDNCATRIRDLLLLTYQGVEFSDANGDITYRQLIHKYLNNRPWEKLGIDLVLGVSADEKTDIYQQMFLPDYLFEALNATKHNGTEIIKENRTIYVSEQSHEQSTNIITPALVFWCIFILSVLFCFLKKGARIFDFILFLTVGIIGCILLLLWFFTDHIDMQANYNIIWAFPFHVVMSFFILCNKYNNFLKWYFLIIVIANVLLLSTWAKLPQELNLALIPLIMSVSLRAICIFRNKSSVFTYSNI